MKKITVSVLLMVTTFSGYAQALQAQTPLKPGDPVIRYDLMRRSHSFYKNTTTDTSGKILYEFMMEDVTIIDSANKQIIFARYRQVPLGSFSTDTSVTDFQLKPLRMHEIHYQHDVSFDMTFGDTEATVVTLRKGVRSVRNYPMKSGYFEDNMIAYLFGWLDLKPGVRYVLDNFNKDTPAPSDPYVLEYVFDDMLDLVGSHQLDCRVLHFVHGLSSGYIWIDKDTRQVLKEEGVYNGVRRFVVQKS